MRQLLTVMVTETVMATVTAQLAVVTSTRYKLKQCCWLEIVSTSAKVEENETATYQCYQGHPSVLQSIHTVPLGVDVNVEDLKLKL